MISKFAIVKLIRSSIISPEFKDIWPILVRGFLNRLELVKFGFPGIRSDHMTLWVTPPDVSPETLPKIFIHDPAEISIPDYLNLQSILNASAHRTVSNYQINIVSSEPPVMYRNLGDGNLEIIGFGFGVSRDPMMRLIPGDIVSISDSGVSPGSILLSVDVRPHPIHGGPGYYYFWKSYHDYRS